MGESKKAVILILAAHDKIAANTASSLEKAGYQVMIYNQKDCIDGLLAQVDPCLVFIDTSCLAQEIRAQPKYARIPIVLSGREISSDERIQSLESDIDYCLDETVYPLELVARVHALLRRCN
jgi:DNA-binding response OmpR family regulator